MKITKLQKIIDGLQLIKSVEPDTTLRAEHDEIWCGDDDNKYSLGQCETLRELGWDNNDISWHCDV